MADRRMFSNKVVGSDAFKEMPLSTQALYFHLGMNADDEGFLNNAKSVQRSINSTDDDMRILIAKHYVIPFPSGVIVLRHWKLSNQIQPSRIKLTTHTEERRMIGMLENKVYELIENISFHDVDKLPTDCRQTSDIMSHSIVENSVVKNSIGECSVMSTEHIQEIAHTLTDEEYHLLTKEFKKSLVDSKCERAKSYVGCYNYQTIKKWCEEDKKHFNQLKTEQYQSFPQNTYDYSVLEDELLAN